MPTPLNPITWTVDGWVGNAIDDAGIHWLVHTDEGWWDPPAPRLAHSARRFGHGSYRGHAYNESRVISLQGVMTAPTGRLADLAAQQFPAILGDGELHELVVTDETLTSMSCMVERAGQPKFSRINRAQAEFQLQVIAPDPRKHAATATPGEARLPQGTTGGLSAAAPGVSAAAPGVAAGSSTSIGSVAVANIGTAPAAPVLELVGPLPAPMITVAETGVRLAYTEDIPAGRTVYINTDVFAALGLPARSVLLDGVSDRRRYLSLPQGWPIVAPRSTATFSITSPSLSPTALLRVHLRPAWW